MPFKRMVRRRRNPLRGRSLSRIKRSTGAYRIGRVGTVPFSIPRLVPRGIHYFKRVGAQIPLSLLYTSTPTANFYVQSKVVNTAGGAQITGISMASSASAGTANNCTGGSYIYGGNSNSGFPNTGSFGISWMFSLQQVVEHLDFTGLFDRYKIAGVKLDVIFHHNNAQIAGGALFPTLYHVFDGDDATIPTTLNSVLKQENCKVKVLSRGGKYSIFCKPRQLLSPATDTAGSTKILTERAKWNNTADAGVQHYAIKMFVDDIYYNTNTSMLITLQPTFYLQMRDTQ